MKKSLLLASMAAVSLSSLAQAVDPVTYEAKEGYTLTSKWMMSRGNNENGVATQAWLDLEAKMGNPGKGTTATILGDKVYIACSTSYKPAIDENGNPFQALTNDGHLLVLDLATGAFVKDLELTLNGAPYSDLLCANQVGTDDFGHIWICGYRGTIWDDTKGAGNPLNLYTVDPETGAMTLVNAFVLDELDGPQAGKRTDYYDVVGNLDPESQEGAAFLAVPNEVAKGLIWVKYAGTTEWDVTSNSTHIVEPKDTYPAGQVAWNYSPMGSFVRTNDGVYEGGLVWFDGHTTNPALYDMEGELLSSFKEHAGDAVTKDDPVGGPWAEYLPERQPNGMLQFTLGGEELFAYAIHFPDDKNLGGNMAIVKLDANATLAEGTPMWVAPGGEGRMGIAKGEGRFSHSIVVTPVMTDASGKEARDIIVYKDKNGIACYTIAQEGYNAGVTDAAVEATGAVEYFNLSGVRCEGNLLPGLYISRQGQKVSKVVVK